MTTDLPLGVTIKSEPIDENQSASSVVEKKKRRKKKKQKKQIATTAPVKLEPRNDVEIEYVVSNQELEEIQSDPNFASLASVFAKFALPVTEEDNEVEQDEKHAIDDAEMDTEATNTKKRKYTKKERKQMKREKIAVLKQLVDRPDVVEVHDVNASDPSLLVYLKSIRNSVPVPRHWSQRRKYLQGKRGVEKPPFELPDFIKATGIATIRQAVMEKEEQMRSKQKQRERVTGRMGKIDIDYQVLYDAFFRFQTKPKLTIHGDLYYEGKEFEVNMKERKPGVLSRELKEALGMLDGMPPPWLGNMQRYGPPPSFPNLVIPGLNAPPPPGTMWGGAWGRPPVDENGKPLYGDWSLEPSANDFQVEAPAARELKPWGELEEEEAEESEEEEEEEDEEEGGEETGDDQDTEQDNEVDTSGTESYTGLETPETMVLRRDRTAPTPAQSLYTVLPTVSSTVGGALVGSAHRYQMPGATGERVELFKSQKTDKVDITFAPTDLEDGEGLSEDLIRRKYQEQVEADKEANRREDVSDVIAEHNAKKRKAYPGKGSEQKAKRQKEFKF